MDIHNIHLHKPKPLLPNHSEMKLEWKNFIL